MESLFESISKIDDVVRDAEISVTESLLNVHMKNAIMMEYNVDHLLFQEDANQVQGQLNQSQNKKNDTKLKQMFQTVCKFMTKIFNRIKYQINSVRFRVKYNGQDMSFQNIKNLKGKDKNIDKILQMSVQANVDVETLFNLYGQCINAISQMSTIENYKTANNWIDACKVVDITNSLNNIMSNNQNNKHTYTFEMYIDFITKFNEINGKLVNVDLSSYEKKFYQMIEDCFRLNVSIETPYKIYQVLAQFNKSFNNFNINVSKFIHGTLPQRFNESFKNNGIPMNVSTKVASNNNNVVTESAKTTKRFNDKGDEVPNVCTECGSKIGVFIQGEPVYLCTNKDCGKYFGTLPCNL